MTLFAIQPQDSAGSGRTTSATSQLDYGPAITYPIILAFFFSLLQANWTYTGYDASAHVAEETVGARVASAWGVFLSVAVSAVVGLHLPVRPDHAHAEPDRAVPGDLDDPATYSQYYFGGGVAVIAILGLQPRRYRRRHPRGRHRDRDGVLRPVVGRLGRPDAVRLQPRRRAARLGLAEEGLAPLPDPGELLTAIVVVSGCSRSPRSCVRRPGGGGIAIIIVTAISTIFLYAAYGVVHLPRRDDPTGSMSASGASAAGRSRSRGSRVFWVVVLMVLFSWPTSGNISSRSWSQRVILLVIYYFAWARSRFKGPRSRATRRADRDRAGVPARR